MKLRIRPFLAPLAVVAAGILYWRSHVMWATPPAGAITPPIARAPRDAAPQIPKKRAASRDVTFFAVSDTHLGFVPEAREQLVVDTMGAMEGKAYPARVGGVVGKPRGLIITGDLTDSGEQDEWNRFLYFWGSTPTTPSAAGLEIPVFEVIGNHDNGPGPWISDRVAERHGGKPYAFDFDDVHFVALGEAPDDNALDWLERDLGRFEKDVPLIVYFHRALAGPWADNDWFDTGDYKGRIAKILEGRCVAGIIHGHHHATDHYVWHGIDVYKPGALKHDAPTFAVMHIANETMSVAYYNYAEKDWIWSQTKNVCSSMNAAEH
ncbi:MAG: metallophosphoesterase [Polyangiaceae bacterium]